MLTPMQDTPGSLPSQAGWYLVRCPACHEWFEDADFVRPTEAQDGPMIYPCPRDSTVLEPLVPRRPPPSPPTDGDGAVTGCLFISWLLFLFGWMFAALPLLAGAILLLFLTGNAIPLVVWAVVSAFWLVLLKVMGPVNN